MDPQDDLVGRIAVALPAHRGGAHVAERAVLGEVGVLVLGYNPADVAGFPIYPDLKAVSVLWCDAENVHQFALPETASRIYREMLDNIVGPTCFAMTRSAGEVSSIAYGAVSCGMLVIESVATRADLRRQGHARRTVSALIQWATTQGASHACLQVVADNAPAVRLYESLGFETELYRYAYRRLPN